jgi:hypothetical protein
MGIGIGHLAPIPPPHSSMARATQNPAGQLTGAGAGPRGHCQLAACPGDRIPRSRTRIRSRIFGSNHFAFLSLALRIGSGYGPMDLVLALRSSPCCPHRLRFRAQSNSSVRRHLARQRPLNRQHGIYPTSPADRVLRLQLFRLLPPPLPLLPLRSSVTPRACAPRFERASLTRGDGGLHARTSGSPPEHFFW